MEFHQLRYFVSAAEAGSLSGAARQCHVSQPTLSQQVRKLERRLGVRLFLRSGGGVGLTEGGRALLPRARRILAEAQAIERRLRADIEDGAGPFVLGAIPTMAPYLVPALLGALAERFPRCELEFREDLTDHLLDAILADEVDCAIMSTPIERDGVEVEVLGEEAFVVVTPAGADAPLPDEVTVAQLLDEPAVLLLEMHCMGEQIADFCNASGVGRRVVCRSAQISTLLDLVGLGIGISMVPEMAVRADANARGRRRYHRFRRSAPTREISLVVRAGRRRSTVIDEVAARVRDVLAGGDQSS